jgi:uncharacterized membrane protein YcaP (DUF421 family)
LYIFVVFVLRIIGRRELSSMTPFDLIDLSFRSRAARKVILSGGSRKLLQALRLLARLRPKTRR